MEALSEPSMTLAERWTAMRGVMAAMAAWKLAMKLERADAAAVRLVLQMKAAWLVLGSDRHGAEKKRKMRAATAAALDR